MRSHVRRLEALRRAGHVERIDTDKCKVPKDIVERGQAYDLSQGGHGLKIRTLSAISLDRQIASDGATWLDRQTIADDQGGQQSYCSPGSPAGGHGAGDHQGWQHPRSCPHLDDS